VKDLFLRTLFAVVSLSFFEAPSFAQDNARLETPKTSVSVQDQINALKQGQEQILKELGEIKKLLQERPGRVDYSAKPTAPNAISLNVHGEPFKGDSRARVAIMEYSDFDCSFCAKYATEIYPLIDENYIKPGKVKYFFRDLLSPEYPNALFNARLARCAGEQGKFWEMHDRLFANPSAVTGQDFAPHAQALGLNTEKLRQCLASDRYTENIRSSTVGAARIGIRGTPAFLIGTVTADGDFLRTTNVFVGADSYAAIKSFLDELLTPPPSPPTN
jgi:protein-disulfide isomerase